MTPDLLHADLLLTPVEVQEIARVSKSTLNRWRRENKILGWIKIGRSVRYKASDVYQLLNGPEGVVK